MATIGGNLCNASPSADTAPPLIALAAEAVIAGLNGEKRIMVEEFFLGPGITALQPGELLKEIRIPDWPARSGSFYLRHTPRAWMDLAFASVSAVVTLDEQGRINGARLALGAVAPTPIRAFGAEEVLEGQSPGEDLLAEAGRRAAAICQPIDDLRASAEYRRHLVSVLTQRALRQAIQRAEGNHET
jgi:carbon-monoxide dehydrogenase medium subunit